MGIGMQPISQPFRTKPEFPAASPPACQSCQSHNTTVSPFGAPWNAAKDVFMPLYPQNRLSVPVDPQGVYNSSLPPVGDFGRHYVNLGERYYEANRFREAIGAFNVAIQLNSQDYVAYNKRGVAKASIKDYAGAMADYTMAISIQPDFYNAYVNRGNLKVYVRDYKGALTDYDQAVRINPWHNAAYENRSEVYSMLGRRDLALRDKAFVIYLQKLKKPTGLGLPYCPKRVALVMWNDDYAGTENDLKNGPNHDGIAMASTLQSQGFQVITGRNLTGQQMRGKVQDFIKTLNKYPGAVSLIYYSGHGGSIHGNNFLIPVDYTGTVDPGFLENAVSVDYLLKELKNTNSLFNMIFLDACRTPLRVPPPQSGATLEMLRQWENEPGPGLSNVWIEYASRPKMPALQDDNSGLYTKYLIQYMSRPGLSLKEVSMYTSFALEKDPIAYQESQHSRVQSDLSRTGPIAEAFSFARQCSPGRFRPPATPVPVQNTVAPA